MFPECGETKPLQGETGHSCTPEADVLYETYTYLISTGRTYAPGGCPLQVPLSTNSQDFRIGALLAPKACTGRLPGGHPAGDHVPVRFCGT
jgi:hypothetical protein